MSDKIVECIPNFSEGRNQSVIDEISKAASSVAGARLINVNVEPSYNRCVHTIVGEPDAVIEATFRACAKAVELIDMNKHKGEHPRIGAIDASPFVPVKNVTLNDCVEYANRLGERVANELKVPVYLYEAAARKPERVKLQNIRHPEYEGLKDCINVGHRSCSFFLLNSFLEMMRNLSRFNLLNVSIVRKSLFQRR